MKTVSTTALALALALGGAAIVAAPAIAKDKKEAAKAPPLKLSPPAQKALGEAQAALAAGDTTTTATKLAEAEAASKTPDDRFMTGQLLYNLSQKSTDAAQKASQRARAFDMMLNSGSALVSADLRYQLTEDAGQRAMDAGDYPKAIAAYNELIKLKPAERNAYALLAEAQVKAGKPAEGLAILQQAMAQAKQSGQPLPKEWYARAVGIAYSAKLPQQTEQFTQEWVSLYPTKDSWRDSLVMWRDVNKIDSEAQIDLMRLQRSAGALKGAADYLEYVDSVYTKNPGEAKAVLDEGVKAGFINLAANPNAKEINGVVTQRMGADKASLAKSAADAKGAKGTAKLATNVADGYLGYGMWAEAADSYRLALAKPGADANLINTRLGMALFRNGDKAGATEAWGKVQGPRAGLVKYWTILMGQGAPTA